MDFDLSSAKPVTTGGSSSGGFDLSSAQPVDAKPAPAPKAATPTPDSGTPFSRASEMYGGLPEAGLGMASGAVAKPLSDIAGLGAIPLHAAGLIKTDPTEVKRKLQDTLTYEPKGPTGKAVSEYNPLSLLAKGVGAAGGAANRMIAPPSAGPVRSAIGHGVEEGINQLPNVLGAKLGDTAAARIPGKQAALTAEKGLNAVQDATRDRAQAAGYITPPEHGIKAGIAGLAGKTRAEKIISAKNTDTATEQLGADVGVPDGAPLSKENIQARKQAQYDVYDSMKDAAGPTLTRTEAFRSNVSETLRKINEAMTRNPEANAPLKTAQKILRGYSKQIDFPTEATLKDIQNQRKWAKDDFRNGDTETGTARIAVADQLEQIFHDNLAKTGKQGLVNDFRAARTQLAKLNFLDRVVNEATGKVDLSKVASLSDTKAYKGVLTGAFKDAADFARSYRKAAQKSTGEAAPRLSVFDGMLAAGAIGSMNPAMMAATAGEIGGRLGVPALAKRGMLQNRTPDYRAGTALPDVLRAGGIGAGVQPPPQ